MAATSPTLSKPQVSAEQRAQEFFDEHNRESRARLRKVLIGVGVAALYPLLDSALNLHLLSSVIPMLMFVILAMGLNIVVGYAGLLDLGYVAFYVIGAYAMAFATSPHSWFVKHGWVPGFMQNFWVAMLFSWVLAAVFGVLLGAPTLRLRGDYLAIVTLGFGEIVPNFFTNAEGMTGGPRGIGQIARPPSIPLPGGNAIEFGTANLWSWYWLILIVGLVSLFVITRLYDSRLGRAWQAIREDEIAAASMGINPVATKLWAFALGASFSGFAGSINAGFVNVVYPDQFQFTQSVIILAMVILGGLGNIYGVIAGGLIIGMFDRVLADKLSIPFQAIGNLLKGGPLDSLGQAMSKHSLTQDNLLMFGLALVLIMLLKPGGLFASKQREQEMKGDEDEFEFDDYESNQTVRAARGREV